MKPLGDPEKPARGRLDVKYDHVDLTTLTDAIEMKGMRLAGRVTGRNLLEWPVGEFHSRGGEGEISAEPPAGVTLQSRTHAGSGPDASDAVAGAGTPGAGHDVAAVLASLGGDATPAQSASASRGNFV